MRQTKFLILTALFLSACNLASSVTTTPDVVASQPAEGDRGGVLPAGTSAPITTSETGTCVPRVDWPLYVVVAGDNLSDIASRAGSTVDELVAANCLDDPDALAVGQELRVPRPLIGSTSASGSLTYTSTSAFAFDYPSGWYIQNIPGGPVTGISLSSFPYDLNNEPPEAGWTSDMVIITFAFVPPALASNNLATWFSQEKSQLSEIGDVTEESITLPSGLPAMRLGFVSGSGHFINMFFTIINGNNILVSARGNSNLYLPIINSLRSA